MTFYNLKSHTHLFSKLGVRYRRKWYQIHINGLKIQQVRSNRSIYNTYQWKCGVAMILLENKNVNDTYTENYS